MQCECFSWARQFNKEKLITKHHPVCPNFKGIDVEVKESILQVLPYINNLYAANELARYLMLNLTTDVKFNKELRSISDTTYLTIPVEDALMNKNKDGFTFSSVEYTTEKYNFYFSDGINYCDTEMSYEFLCNYIPFPVGLLLLIEK